MNERFQKHSAKLTVRVKLTAGWGGRWRRRRRRPGSKCRCTRWRRSGCCCPTGLRRNEVLALRWRDVDLDAREIKLEDSKTGARVAPLSPEAARVLAGIPRVEGNPHVIPGKKPGTHLRNLNDPWDRIRKGAKLEDVRLHDCRHSFASRALALGEGLIMIGKLLGHTKVETTARYAHLARESVRESAIRVSDSIAADILKGYPAGGGDQAPAKAAT